MRIYGQARICRKQTRHTAYVIEMPMGKHRRNGLKAMLADNAFDSIGILSRIYNNATAAKRGHNAVYAIRTYGYYVE